MKSSTANVGGGGGVKTTLHALRGEHESAQLSQQKSPTPSPPQAINNDRSLMENVNKKRRHFISLSELRYGR